MDERRVFIGSGMSVQGEVFFCESFLIKLTLSLFVPIDISDSNVFLKCRSSTDLSYQCLLLLNLLK